MGLQHVFGCRELDELDCSRPFTNEILRKVTRLNTYSLERQPIADSNPEHWGVHGCHLPGRLFNVSVGLVTGISDMVNVIFSPRKCGIAKVNVSSFELKEES